MVVDCLSKEVAAKLYLPWEVCPFSLKCLCQTAMPFHSSDHLFLYTLNIILSYGSSLRSKRDLLYLHCQVRQQFEIKTLVEVECLEMD